MDLILDALLERGFCVEAARTDHGALALLEREADDISVLVTDINLGEGVTGFDIARKARLLNPAMSVIYIAGLPQDLDRFGVTGAQVILKPFVAAALAEQVAVLATAHA